MRRDKTTTRKLGRIEDTPSTVFGYRRRDPGWHTDAAGETVREEVFIEEAIEEKGGIFRPFPVPQVPSGEPFAEPTTNSSKDRLKFQEWILGGKIDTSATASAFSKIIAELARLARNYNASLYHLRRIQYAADHPTSIQPTPNPHGGNGPVDPNDAAQVAAARRDYEKCTKAIDDFIELEQDNHKLIAVDMVEVNNYIVSMRVIATKTVAPGGAALEIGGSSSSHVSVSSAFSSSSP